jgi:hypothetical protein
MSEKAEPFPSLTPIQSEATEQNGSNAPEIQRSPANTSAPSSTGRRTRTSSLRNSFLNSNPPLGMWQATGEVSSKVPTLNEIRTGSFSAEGWSHEGQLERRGANPHEIHQRRLNRTSSASTRTRRSSQTATTPVTPTIVEEGASFFPRRGSVSASQKERRDEEARVREEEVKRYSSPPTPLTIMLM